MNGRLALLVAVPASQAPPAAGRSVICRARPTGALDADDVPVRVRPDLTFGRFLRERMYADPAFGAA